MLTEADDLIHSNVGRPDDSCPLLRVVDNELAEIRSCHRLWNATHLAKSRFHLRIDVMSWVLGIVYARISANRHDPLVKVVVDKARGSGEAR